MLEWLTEKGIRPRFRVGPCPPRWRTASDRLATAPEREKPTKHLPHSWTGAR